MSDIEERCRGTGCSVGAKEDVSWRWEHGVESWEESLKVDGVVRTRLLFGFGAGLVEHYYQASSEGEVAACWRGEFRESEQLDVDANGV